MMVQTRQEAGTRVSCVPMRWLWLLCGVICLAAMPLPVFALQEATDPAQSEGAVSSVPVDAAAQLKHAYSVKKKSFKKDEEEKRRYLNEAIVEYRKVLDMFPDDAAGCALACFRVGEIERSLGETEKAAQAFRAVLRYGDQHATVARAFLELGHLARRSKDLESAIDLYGQTVRQCPEVRDQGARAWLWIAKCQREQKTLIDARESARRIIADYADEARSMMAAYDLVAMTYLDEGNATLAADTLRECRERFAALEATGEKAHAGAVARVDKLRAWKQLDKVRKSNATSADDTASESPDTNPGGR